MVDTIHISNNLQIKSSVKNAEQLDIALVEWNNYDTKICPQCGQDHSYKITGGNAIQGMISFLDRNRSEAL
jgi:hypothetical protein